ncbi:MAG: hypothetical protein LBD24_07965 [Spirochaetaceae bacterium]|jgi:hypothetical protein|nr:hypothetical protein [Spirochaetaceae bacterium]
MGIEKVEDEKAPNEFVFEKTKGFGRINYLWHTTKVTLEEAGLTVAHTRQLMFSKKVNNLTINYSDLERIELKTNFAKGDLIAGIIIGIISVATQQLWGVLGTAFLVFFAYCKDIVLVRKDGSKVLIQNGGPLSGGGLAEFERMVPLLTTKIGRQIYAKPMKV